MQEGVQKNLKNSTTPHPVCSETAKKRYEAPRFGHTEEKRKGETHMNASDKEAYRRYVDRRAARSPVLRNAVAAFWTGGSICVLGQLLTALYRALGASAEMVGTLVAVTLVFFAALLTGLGIFDRIARYAGAGTLVPITGFANAVVSPAMDTKSEGVVIGIGGKIFAVAGPVLLYACLAGAIYGVIYYIVGLF